MIKHQKDHFHNVCIRIIQRNLSNYSIWYNNRVKQDYLQIKVSLQSFFRQLPLSQELLGFQVVVEASL